MRFIHTIIRPPLRRAAIPGAALLGVALALASPARGESGERTWTSRAGSEFTGAFKERREEAAVLVNAAGNELVVPLEQLSAADRAYLLDLERERHERRVAFYRAGQFEKEALPEKAEINGLRHVAQKENFCVPASAEMLLTFHGFSYDQDYLATITSKDSARNAGTHFGDLMKALRNVGVESVPLLRGHGSENSRVENAMTGIRAAIADGLPVLISYETARSGHAVLAVAYDDRRRAFRVMDPAGRSSPTRLDYKVIERVLTGAVVVIPSPRELGEASTQDSPERAAFLSRLSGHLRAAEPGALPGLAQRLKAEGISSRFRNANRADLGSSQGQTRSFARQQGVEFVRLALERGLVVVAPQKFEAGAGLILLYGLEGREFRAVEYLPDGSFRKGAVRPLDFSLRWIWREERNFLLPLLEVDLPAEIR